MATILAVDDSISIRQIVAHTLRSKGHTVIEAVDGVDGLNKAKSGSVNLILTDINMPNMNGIEMIKQVRALPAYKYTPILTLTTESTTEMKMKGKQAGATGWIVKPFRPEQLLATIDKVLR
jgi:two-component system chemotaxis response regulator CheY